MNAKVKQSFCIQMQQKDPVWQAFCICKLWYAANYPCRPIFPPSQQHELQCCCKAKAALSKRNWEGHGIIAYCFSACCDAPQSLYWHHIIASLCLSPCLQDQQQPVAQSLTHLFLLWVMTGKKEGKSRVKSQGPFSAVASASPSSLAC